MAEWAKQRKTENADLTCFYPGCGTSISHLLPWSFQNTAEGAVKTLAVALPVWKIAGASEVIATSKAAGIALQTAISNLNLAETANEVTSNIFSKAVTSASSEGLWIPHAPQVVAASEALSNTGRQLTSAKDAVSRIGMYAGTANEAATIAVGVLLASSVFAGVMAAISIESGTPRDYLTMGAVTAGLVGLSVLTGEGGVALAVGMASLSSLGTFGTWACKQFAAKEKKD